MKIPFTFLSLTAFLLLTQIAKPAQAQLIHYYPFNGNANDAVGSANGALQGGANITSGTLNLDGTTGFVQFAEHIIPTSGSYTVSFFSFRGVSQTNPFVEFISQGSSGGPGFFMGEDPNFIRMPEPWVNTFVSKPSKGVWSHYALVVDALAGTSKFYLNGTQAATFGSAIATSSSGDDTRLGRQFGGFGEYLDGKMDEVRVYSNALNASQVASLASSNPNAPEPTTLVLLALGGTLVIVRRRKA